MGRFTNISISIVSIAVVLLIIGLIVAMPLYVYGTSDTKECLVDSKERVAELNDGRYLIFCEDEVLENTDSLLRLKFDSSDFYRQIEEGETYQFDVYGWRIPFFSTYRNIYEIAN